MLPPLGHSMNHAARATTRCPAALTGTDVAVDAPAPKAGLYTAQVIIAETVQLGCAVVE